MFTHEEQVEQLAQIISDYWADKRGYVDTPDDTDVDQARNLLAALSEFGWTPPEHCRLTAPKEVPPVKIVPPKDGWWDVMDIDDRGVPITMYDPSYTTIINTSPHSGASAEDIANRIRPTLRSDLY